MLYLILDVELCLIASSRFVLMTWSSSLASIIERAPTKFGANTNVCLILSLGMLLMCSVVDYVLFLRMDPSLNLNLNEVSEAFFVSSDQLKSIMTGSPQCPDETVRLTTHAT
jgi:hypothetical protein